MNSFQNSRDWRCSFMDNELLRKENRELKRTVKDLVNQNSNSKSQYLKILQEKENDEDNIQLKKMTRPLFDYQTVGNTKQDLNACTQLYHHMETTLKNNLVEDFSKLKDDYMLVTEKLTNQTLLYESLCKDSKILVNENSVLSSQVLDINASIEDVKHNNVQLTKQRDELENSTHVLSAQCDGLKHQLKEERTIKRKLKLNISSNNKNSNNTNAHYSLDNGDEPWRTFKQLQPVYHSAGSSPPCSLCLEPPYGLMVKCRECGHEHHSVCSKKLLKTAGTHSCSSHDDLFTCARCKKA